MKSKQKRNKMDQETLKKTIMEDEGAYFRNTRRVSSVELEKKERSSTDWMINDPKSMSDMLNKCKNIRSSGNCTKGGIIRLQMAQKHWSLQTMKNRQHFMDNNDNNTKTEMFTDYTTG